MSEWFPEGEIQVRGFSADGCTGLIATRIEAANAGQRPVRGRRAGRLYGRVFRGRRFWLCHRVSYLIHSGALVLRATVEDAPQGCVIRFRTRIQRMTLWFWIIWTFNVLAAIGVGVLSPEPSHLGRIILRFTFLVLIPILIYFSLRRGEWEIRLVIGELCDWLGENVVHREIR